MDVFSKKDYMSEEFKKTFSNHVAKYLVELNKSVADESIKKYLMSFFLYGLGLFERSYAIKNEPIKEFFISFWVITLQAAMNPEKFNEILKAMAAVSPNTVDARIFETINKTLQ